MQARIWSLITGVVFIGALSTAALPPPDPCTSGTQLLLANNSTLAFIDVNQNGVIDAPDCIVRGKGILTDDGSGDGDAMGNLCFLPTQSNTSLTVIGCSGPYTGMSEVNGPGNFGNASQSGGPSIFFFEQSSPSDTALGAQSKGTVPLFPAVVNGARVVEGGEIEVGRGLFCSDGGLAVRGTVRGVTGIVRFAIKQIGGVESQVEGAKQVGGQPFACGNVPIPVFNSESFPLSLPVCFPVGPNGSNPSFRYEGDGTNYVELNVTDLSSCGTLGTPTASAAGLLGLALALLAAGVWVLRRRGFAGALPRI